MQYIGACDLSYKDLQIIAKEISVFYTGSKVFIPRWEIDFIEKLQKTPEPQ